MKAILKSTIITTIFTLLFSFNMMADINFNDETYIDDIPFSTEAIYSQVVIDRHILDFEMQEEAYINDIPFNTDTIADDKLYDLALEEKFTLEEESYIDDIPFSTEQVCENVLHARANEVLTCENIETLETQGSEVQMELKYFEQDSHILVRF